VLDAIRPTVICFSNWSKFQAPLHQHQWRLSVGRPWAAPALRNSGVLQDGPEASGDVIPFNVTLLRQHLHAQLLRGLACLHASDLLPGSNVSLEDAAVSFGMGNRRTNAATNADKNLVLFMCPGVLGTTMSPLEAAVYRLRAPGCAKATHPSSETARRRPKRAGRGASREVRVQRSWLACKYDTVPLTHTLTHRCFRQYLEVST
jgi:hypothetical protein